MTFARPSLSELIVRAEADIDARLPGADSRLRRNALNVLARVHAGALHGAYGMLDNLSRFLPDVAETEVLERWASIKGLTRKPAGAASGTATAAGVNDTDIPEGTVLVRSDGARYVVNDDATIAAGTAVLAISAEALGVAGAMAEGQLLTFLSPIAGVGATVAIAAPGVTGGADQESDAELRARLLLSFRNPVRGGSASDYVIWALEVPEVTRAWVYENWDGLGTVKLLFTCDGRADIIPDAGDIDLVEEWVEARRPVCAAVTVAAPTSSAVNYDIDLTPDTADTRAAVEAALRDLHAREAEPGGTLLISHIREAVSGAAGETDSVVNSPNANVVAAAGQIKIVGTFTW